MTGARTILIPVVAAGVGILANVSGVGIAHAQVLEIRGDGEVIHHDGPALYLNQDVRPQPIPNLARLDRGAQSSTATRQFASYSITQAISESSDRHGLSPYLVEAVAWRESRFRPRVISPKGAMGIMQLMPATARNLSVDPFDARANIEGGASLLASLMQRYGGDIIKTLAAYNAGTVAVDRYGGLPPYRETRLYVAGVLERLAGRQFSLKTPGVPQ